MEKKMHDFNKDINTLKDGSILKLSQEKRKEVYKSILREREEKEKELDKK
ncbi:MAG: hypothetical protein MJ252_02075 [archaeon]|nr:hypothetical protein [archaeon]